MSLLMQALKKAETAKQKQGDPIVHLATPGTIATPASVPEALSLQPQEPSRHVKATAEADTAVATVVEPVDYFAGDPRPVPPPISRTSFDGELGFSATPRATFAAAQAAVEPPAASSADVHAPASVPLTGAPPKLKIGIEQQEAAALAAKQNLAARNSARSVFASKTLARNRRPIVIAGLGIMILAIAAGYGYIQYMGLTKPPVLLVPPQSDTVAVLAPTPDTSQTPIPETTQPSAAATAVAALPPDPVVQRPVQAPTSPSPQDVQVMSRAPTPAPFASPAPATVTAPSAVAERPLPASRPQAPVTAPESAPIQIRRSNATARINPTLSTAYQAFQAGDINGAHSQYQRVLQQEPDNRDALLGIAAIALNRGQNAQAGSFYTRLLELDPADPDAAAGLASLTQGDASQSESRLKKILSQNPQTGSALFALGNVYAAQSRWPEAQQAYFRAFGITPGSADYAFNLAVSLDKLNQSRLALDYYQRAIALARESGGNVDKDAVLNRIRELQVARAESD